MLRNRFKAIITTVVLFVMMLVSFSACSDNEPSYTGTLNVVFSKWVPEWAGRTYIIVSPLENKDKVIKRHKIVSKTEIKIELNPGNYFVKVGYDSDGPVPWVYEYVQIQIGKTETIEIK